MIWPRIRIFTLSLSYGGCWLLLSLIMRIVVPAISSRRLIEISSSMPRVYIWPVKIRGRPLSSMTMSPSMIVGSMLLPTTRIDDQVAHGGSDLLEPVPPESVVFLEGSGEHKRSAACAQTGFGHRYKDKQFMLPTDFSHFGITGGPRTADKDIFKSPTPSSPPSGCSSSGNLTRSSINIIRELKKRGIPYLKAVLKGFSRKGLWCMSRENGLAMPCQGLILSRRIYFSQDLLFFSQSRPSR